MYYMYEKYNENNAPLDVHFLIFLKSHGITKHCVNICTFVQHGQSHTIIGTTFIHQDYYSNICVYRPNMLL